MSSMRLHRCPVSSFSPQLKSSAYMRNLETINPLAPLHRHHHHLHQRLLFLHCQQLGLLSPVVLSTQRGAGMKISQAETALQALATDSGGNLEWGALKVHGFNRRIGLNSSHLECVYYGMLRTFFCNTMMHPCLRKLTRPPLHSPFLAKVRAFTSSPQEVAISKIKEAGLLHSKGLIGGKWVEAEDGRTLPVHNPATGEVLVEIPCMGEVETKAAIDAASKAFLSWRELTGSERSKLLRKWYDLLIANKEHLGHLITLEQGKPLTESFGEVVYGSSFVEFFAEEAKRLYGDIIPAPVSDRRLLVLKQPVGVVGAITPWNFPLAMITRKVGAALAAGCTSVIKPSELTPLTALAAAELAAQAGIPPGVLNVVMGDAPRIGDTLMESTEVRKITFTGSTAVGKKLMAAAAGTVKKVSLELGGNAPCIIFDDADIDVAVKGTLNSKFRNSGQTCVCANRVFVQSGIYDKFATAFANAVKSLEVGNGFIKGVCQGPLINEAAVDKVERHLEDAISKGAKVLLGGKRHSLGGTFYEPTVIGDATTNMLIFREEVFGPVAPLIRFTTEDEVIQMANDTVFGLAAYFFTQNMARAWRVAEALDYGLVGVNEGIISTEVAPFGGVKQSGLGREGSKYGIEEYLEMKYVCMGNIQK